MEENRRLLTCRIASAATFMTLIAASSSAATAADLAGRPYVKAPAAVAAVVDWSGLYVGANAGYAASHECWDVIAANGPTVPDGCPNARGGFVGGQVGYRWQVGNWVLGVEAQGDWADLAGSVRAASVLPASNETRVDRFGVFTGQLGYAVNSALIYLKGGAAVTSNKFTAVNINVPTFTSVASDTRWGAALGIGLEYGFGSGWSVAVEYDRLLMSDQTNLFITPASQAVAGRERISQDIDLVSLRLNYRFGGSAVR